MSEELTTEAARRIVAVMYAPPYEGMFKPALIRELRAVEAEARAPLEEEIGYLKERLRRCEEAPYG